MGEKRNETDSLVSMLYLHLARSLCLINDMISSLSQQAYVQPGIICSFLLSGQVANSSFSAHRSTLAGSAGWISQLMKIVGKQSSDSNWGNQDVSALAPGLTDSHRSLEEA
jgi:hypothetical protein